MRPVRTGRLALALLLAAAPLSVVAAQQPAAPALTAAPPRLTVIPRPDSVAFDSGSFALTDPIEIAVTTPSPRLMEIAGLLREWLGRPSEFRAVVWRGRAGRGTIALTLDPRAGEGPEGYTLTVTPEGIRIAAPSPAGVLWGVQTLRQLLPPAFDDTAGARPDHWTIPALVIRDAPRFRWRGALLDATRHFFPPEFVKRFVDLLSRYKLDVLHWHLTDDQGWRLDVPRWPRLTTVGAWRTDPDGVRYGGWYSEGDIRSVVEYARLRGVTVVPEIEMPGHSTAAIASYPWLGCTGDSIPVANTWGVFPDILCPRDSTFAFLHDVLREVVDLFPGTYVHLGGDEVPKDQWKACADCRALMASQHLATGDDLESWFLGRIGAWLAAHGRRMIGWDDITGGPVPPGATIEVWRDTSLIGLAARAGYDVIAAPGGYTYLNRSPAELPLSRVYAFDPLPAGLTPGQAARVLGGEATLWSERITTANFDLMAFPRLLAFAEALWTRGPRDFADFERRLAAGEAPRLAALGVSLGPEDSDVVSMTPDYDSTTGSLGMRVATGVPGVTVHFTTDGSRPTVRSPVYADSMRLRGVGTARFRPFYRGEPLPMDRTITLVPNLAVGRPYTLTAPPSPQYPGTGPRTLTDGALGSLDFHDGLWQGWQGTDLEALVDLGRPIRIASVAGSFLQAPQSWILAPRLFTVWLSDDGTTWREAGAAADSQPPLRADPFREMLRVAMPPGTVARYVQVRAPSPGPMPAGAPGTGHPSWIFCDEIIVR